MKCPHCDKTVKIVKGKLVKGRQRKSARPLKVGGRLHPFEGEKIPRSKWNS